MQIKTKPSEFLPPFLLLVSRCISWHRIKSVSETELPDLLGQLVEDFQTFMKKQKETSEELGRFSRKPFKTVEEGITAQDQVRFGRKLLYGHVMPLSNQNAVEVNQQLIRHTQLLAALKRELSRVRGT